MMRNDQRTRRILTSLYHEYNFPHSPMNSQSSEYIWLIERFFCCFFKKHSVGDETWMFRHSFWPLSQLLSHWEPSCGGESERHAEPPYMDEFPLHKSECFGSTAFFFLIKMEIIPVGAHVESIQKMTISCKITPIKSQSLTIKQPWMCNCRVLLEKMDVILTCHAHSHLSLRGQNRNTKASWDIKPTLYSC